jgi:foldase protein PrsA
VTAAFRLAVPSAYYSAVRKVNPVRKVLILLLVLAVAGTACAGGNKTVATVNGSEITLSDVQALAPSGGTVDTATFDSNLRNLVIEAVVLQAAEADWGLTIDQASIDSRYNDIVASIGTQADLQQYLSDNAITEDTLRHVALQQLLGTAIDDQLSTQIGPISDAELQGAYEGAKESQSTVCVHHILVASEDEANTVIDRLAAGEKFEDVATELSTDTTTAPNGGDLGCAAPSTYEAPFAEATLIAPVGEVYGPVETSYGFHVIRVDSRDVPTFDDLKSQLQDQLTQQQGAQLFSDWITSKVDNAAIEIDPAYGTWAGSPDYQVNPPA